MNTKVVIRRLKTGVPGLDDLLGGGLPEYSFNLLAGTPGSGKTTLAHQIMFALANPDRRAIFFTVLGESPLKMLRYQQQFSFFDVDKINDTIKFVNLAAELLDGDFDQVLARITEEIDAFSPGLVFVDSFRSVVESTSVTSSSKLGLQHFVQHLGMKMASWQATTFLIGEYHLPEAESSPVFTVADGIIWLSQMVHRDATIRKIQVVKMRGQAQSPGVHTCRITEDGLEVFPRAVIKSGPEVETVVSGDERLSMGTASLDDMMGGGLPVGYSLLVVGPSGSGKTVLATSFIAEGVRLGQPGVVAAFEKSPNQMLSQKLNDLVTSGHVSLISTRSLDLSIDEVTHDLVSEINRKQAKRVVIDSLSGFELALAPIYREDFRESLYRLIAVLTGMGVTVLMTAELEDRYDVLRFSGYGNAFLSDAIIVQRYIELKGRFERVISVVKLRASAHSKDIRFFEIGDEGIVIGNTLSNYTGILTGVPVEAG